MEEREKVDAAPVDRAVSRNRCLGCRCGMTWANVRVQYNRALKRGLSPNEAKAACPRCQKCMTKFLRERAG